MSQCHGDLRSNRWFGLVRRDPAYAFERGSQLRQLIEREVRLFRQVDALCGAEKSLEKAVDLLTPYAGEVLKSGSCLRYVKP